MTNTHNDTTAKQLRVLMEAITRCTEKYERKPKTSKSWCSPQHAKQIRKQHQLHHKSKQQPTVENIAKHRQCRNATHKMIRQAKKQSIVAQLEEAKHDAKQAMQVLQQVVPRKNMSRATPTELKVEGVLHTQPQDIANELNKHFITIGGKTAATLQQEPQQGEEQREQQQEERHNNPEFKLKAIAEEKVLKILKNTNPYKATDIYKIKPRITKDLAYFLAPIFTRLFNKAIQENYHPDVLKMTKVVELYKKGDKTSPENYRPISLLPIIAKVLDTAINTQLMDHLLTNNILSPTQYAYRPNSSTIMALQTILNNIHKNKSQHRPTVAIYIDLSKAFDTVSHVKLIDKLKKQFNFEAGTLNFFKSYFRNRQQSTHTLHACSTTSTITHGIPQGSTLSTTLFNLYINDIFKTVNSDVYTYADDTTLVVTAAREADLQALAQSELGKLITYFHRNNLVPNANKTVHSTFYGPHLEIKVGDTVVEHTETTPLLGIQVQTDFQYEVTLAKLVAKLQHIARQLAYANKLLPLAELRKIYFMHVYSHIIYAITIWGTTNPNTGRLSTLIKLHKKIIRRLCNKPRDAHTAPLMRKMQILPLHAIYFLRVCAEVHKYDPSHVRPAATNLPRNDHTYKATWQVHKHNTRAASSRRLFTTQPYTHYSKPNEIQLEHFNNEYSRIYNLVPDDIRAITSTKEFKIALANYLANNDDFNHY